MYKFPEGLYSDVRVERHSSVLYQVQNKEVKANTEVSVDGAMIRVYDGLIWYTSVVNDLNAVQEELDRLAAIAQPRPDIAELPLVKRFQVNKDRVLRFEGENDVRRISRAQREGLVQDYIKACASEDVPEVKNWFASYSHSHLIKEFYSSKGAEIVQDYQQCGVFFYYDFVVNGQPISGGRGFQGMDFDAVAGHEDEVISRRDRYLDYAKNAVDVVPGEYVCVLAPEVTGMFTHESFGHKSEADFMLNDKALREEWVMGKKVGSGLVSIYDGGDMPEHRGYISYDDEGTRAGKTYLIKDGVLSGRLHDAKSASTLEEELTGNARAQDFGFMPMVRMTNTIMEPGTSTPEEIIAGVKDGIYIYNVNYGTGSSTFTMQPSISYRIRDGKIAEPLRVNVVTGSVFQTLYDIDAVGNDLEICDLSTCGKNGQSMPVSDGGPTIRVRKLNIN